MGDGLIGDDGQVRGRGAGGPPEAETPSTTAWSANHSAASELTELAEVQSFCRQGETEVFGMSSYLCRFKSFLLNGAVTRRRGGVFSSFEDVLGSHF